MPGPLRNTFLAFSGYMLAVIVAAFSCLLVIIGEDIIFNPERVPTDLARTFVSLYAIGLGLTAISAWPGFMATVVLSRWRGYESRLYFALCGVATAILAVLLWAGFGDDLGFAREFLAGTPAIYVGGLAGGLIYALFARRLRVFVSATG